MAIKFFERKAIMSFAVYTEGSSNDVYKDGHKMFNYDVVKELNRKSYLEEKILQSAPPTNKPSAKLKPSLCRCANCNGVQSIDNRFCSLCGTRF